MISRRIVAAPQPANDLVTVDEFAPLDFRDALFQLGFFGLRQLHVIVYF